MNLISQEVFWYQCCRKIPCQWQALNSQLSEVYLQPQFKEIYIASTYTNMFAKEKL